MNVQIMSTPCYLLETVELIYAFVNGVPAEELTGPGSYCIPVREVQRIMDTACAGLALQNPTLQFFFQKEALADDSGDFTCIARNIAYFVSTFSCKTISSAFDLLRKSWLTILQEHSYPASIGRYTFDCGWQDESESESTNLELRVNQLLISPDYRKKLLSVLKNFDYYTQLLEELIAPVERRLELLMVPWVKHSEPLRQNWYAYLTQPDLPSLLQQKWKFVTKEPIDQVYAVLGYFRAKVQMLELETLGNQNVIYIHIGVNCTTDLRDEEEFAPWEIRALRLLGSQARIKLLKAIHAQPMSTRELAQNLGMNLGSVGRDVSSLLTAGLLVVSGLMFIGASPASTGGGIKTTTFFVLLSGIYSAATNHSERAFHSAIPKDAFRKASVISMLAVFLVMTASYLMLIFDPQLSLRDVLFEMISAFSTSGLSTGITSQLSAQSRILSIIMMYIGRLGPLTVASLWYFTIGERVRYPEGTIAIG